MMMSNMALLVQQGLAQSVADSTGILRTTPQSVEDLQGIERQLQDALPKVLSSVVCIEINGGSGSGILISPSGVIWSAAHVLGSPGTQVRIVLSDGTRLPAKTTAQNNESDAGIAIMETNAVIQFPSVPKMQGLPNVGDWVFSLGHGGGLDEQRGPMVRLGRVVSVKEGAIKTDCKLIRGDSGGPLFNLKGELIGIHSRVGSGLEDNLHVMLKDFATLEPAGKTTSPPSPEHSL